MKIIIIWHIYILDKMSQKYTFKTINNHLGYNPEVKLSNFYQVCHFKHPKTNKYHIRKCIYDQNGTLVSVSQKQYTVAQIKKFFEIHKENEYKTYATYDLQLVDFPSGDQIMMAQSQLVNENYDNYGFAPINK